MSGTALVSPIACVECGAFRGVFFERRAIGGDGVLEPAVPASRCPSARRALARLFWVDRPVVTRRRKRRRPKRLLPERYRFLQGRIIAANIVLFEQRPKLTVPYSQAS